jgi:hypothetical protein
MSSLNRSKWYKFLSSFVGFYLNYLVNSTQLESNFYSLFYVYSLYYYSCYSFVLFIGKFLMWSFNSFILGIGDKKWTLDDDSL